MHTINIMPGVSHGCLFISTGFRLYAASQLKSITQFLLDNCDLPIKYRNVCPCTTRTLLNICPLFLYSLHYKKKQNQQNFQYKFIHVMFCHCFDIWPILCVHGCVISLRSFVDGSRFTRLTFFPPICDCCSFSQPQFS